MFIMKGLKKFQIKQYLNNIMQSTSTTPITCIDPALKTIRNDRRFEWDSND